ncbi:hypothetical protein DL768_009480 [Monosporascus sp. mg162]|nr:hypothetical protein DL768_009480 [Monosporascus sp. mg162]
MSTSAEATVPTLTQQLQERVQQLKAHIQQLTAQAAAPVDSVPDNFDNPNVKRKAAQNLLQLKQKEPASKYAVEFRNLMSKAGWVDDKDDTLIDVFYKGLKNDVKDEIIKIERPSAFDKYIAKAVKIDNRQFERRQERRGQFALRSKFQGTNLGRRRPTPFTSYRT